MNPDYRDLLIAKTRDIIHTHYNPSDSRPGAQAILDAILPQITTAEELEALPDRCVLVGRKGFIWSIRQGKTSPLFMLNDYGPFIVVWQSDTP